MEDAVADVDVAGDVLNLPGIYAHSTRVSSEGVVILGISLESHPVYNEFSKIRMTVQRRHTYIHTYNTTAQL